MPKVVYDEVIGNLGEHIDGEIVKVQKVKDRFRSLGINWTPVIPSESEKAGAVDDYAAQLREIIPAVNHLPYPADLHESVAVRSISKRRPFFEKDRGYRDTLIWLTILKYLECTDDAVALVADDGDFRKDKNEDVLHPHLIEDLDQKGIPRDRVTLYKDLATFMGRYVAPQLDSLEELREEIAKGRIAGFFDLQDQVDIYLNESVTQVNIGSFYEPEDLEVDVIEDVTLVDVDEVRLLPSGDVFVRTSWRAEVAIEPDYYGYGYAYAGEHLPANITVDLILNASTYDIEAMENVDFEVDPARWH